MSSPWDNIIEPPRGSEGFRFRNLTEISVADAEAKFPTEVRGMLSAEEDALLREEAEQASKPDYWVYGINLALAVGEVGKTSAEWATYDGGSLNTFLDQVGELMAVGAASLGLWQTARGTSAYVAMWAMVMGSAVSVVTVFQSMAGFGAPDQGSGFSAGEGKHIGA
jgi:hypothetical protein